MDIALIIIEILWLTSAILVVPNVAPYANNLSLWKQAIIAIIIIIVGAPFMLITQAIELLLDIFLEEGWNDDDDKFGS